MHGGALQEQSRYLSSSDVVEFVGRSCLIARSDVVQKHVSVSHESKIVAMIGLAVALFLTIRLRGHDDSLTRQRSHERRIAFSTSLRMQ